MNPDNVYKYVYTGSMFKENSQLYRKTCCGPLLLTLFAGLVPGGILQGFWPFLSLAMMLISVACLISILILSSDVLTVREALRLDVILIGSWVFDFSAIELMYFTMLKGFTPWVLLINLPVVVIPLLFGIKTHKALMKPNYNPKETAKSNNKTSFFFYGILGVSLGSIFRNVDQSAAITIVLWCFGIANGFMSVGFLSIQKLYYIKKFKINL